MKLFIFTIMCILSVSSVWAAEKRSDITQEMHQGILANAQLVIDKLTSEAGFKLDYSEKSVRWVSGFVDRNRDKHPTDLTSIIGSYLGQSVINSYGGKWQMVDGYVAVEVDKDFVVFPINKAGKHFKNGSEDSIYSFYTSISVMLKKHRKKTESSNKSPKFISGFQFVTRRPIREVWQDS